MSGYVKFTGDYAQLKHMGFKFQKLYAANYMSWRNEDSLYIFKRGSTLEHNNYNLYDVIKFLRTSPKVRIYDNFIAFYKFYDDGDNNQYTFLPMNAAHQEIYKHNAKEWGNVEDDTPKDKIPPLFSTETIKKSVIDQLKIFNDLGWYELVEYDDEDY